MSSVQSVAKFAALFFLMALLAASTPALADAPRDRIQFPPPEPLEEPEIPSAPTWLPPPRRIPSPGEPARVRVERPPAPRVISTEPPTGARDVDPALREVRVTFDQDMGTRGYAFWGDMHYPTVTGTATWIDSRTCALPVALAPGRFYRVGVNLRGLNNFKSAAGTAANPHILYFTTTDATPEDIAALTPPRIVTLTPVQGATGITPGKTQFRIVFDQRMHQDFSPVAPDRRKFPADISVGAWSANMRQLDFTGRLEPQRQYVIGLNSPQNIGFQNSHGVPLEPVVWEFDTLRRE